MDSKPDIYDTIEQQRGTIAAYEQAKDDVRKLREVLQSQKTLRDELAMAALTGLLARPLSEDDGFGVTQAGQVAALAYALADVMLQRRNPREPPGSSA